MTLKENVMKLLLEDTFNSLIVKAQGEASIQTSFDVAEVNAQSAINDNPSETDASALAGIAVGYIISSFG